MSSRKSSYIYAGFVISVVIVFSHLIGEIGNLRSDARQLHLKMDKLLSKSPPSEDISLRFIEPDIQHQSFTTPPPFTTKQESVVEPSEAQPLMRTRMRKAPAPTTSVRLPVQEPQNLEDIMADERWIDQRKQLMKAGNPRKVVIFGYMRGGTSLFSEVFNQDERAQAWYEPMGAVYGHLFGLPQFRSYTKIVFSDKKNVVYRGVSKLEENAFKTFFKGIFECDYSLLPTAVLTNTFLTRSKVADEYVQCIQHGEDIKFEHHCLAKGCVSQHCGATKGPDGQPLQGNVAEALDNECPEYLQLARGDSTLSSLKSVNPAFQLDQDKLSCFKEYAQCMSMMNERIERCLETTKFQDICSERRIRVAKILRLKLKEYVALAQEFPDLSLIYYTRDPRAIANSRQYGGTNANLWVTETKQLCKEMYQDYQQMERLKQQFPGLVLKVRYEDLVENPIEKLRKVYAHFNEQPSETVKKWIVYAMFAAENDSAFGVLRKDSRETRDKWKTTYPDDVIQKVTKDPACEPILTLLGYL